MKKLLFSFVLFLSSPILCCAQQHQPPREAREEVEMGLKAHRQAHFEEAKQHFQRALALDKDFCEARLYVAGAFTHEYVPHVQSTDNLAKANQGFEHYQVAMQCDPALSSSALRGMAYLRGVMEQPAEARDLYRQLLKIEGASQDIYGHIAAYDLEEVLANTRAEKARLGLKADESLADTPACPVLRKRNLPLVSDGLEMLSKAMWLHTNEYGADQVTASVFYYERAEIQCGDPAARKADEKNAAEWTALAVKIGQKQKQKEASQK